MTKSAPFRIAINGYGRIGQCVLRALYENGFRDHLRVVAINELSDIDTIAHLTRYDSTHGRFFGKVEASAGELRINGDTIAISHHEQLQDIDWTRHNIDVVLDCSGTIVRQQELEKHIIPGARHVLLSNPGEAGLPTIVYGLNHHELNAEVRVVSNASCTTNGIAPVIDVLHQAFGVRHGCITTLHSAMNDQPVIDAYHSDLRRTRAAVQSIIPVDTGLAIGITRLMPELAGKFESLHVRVPTINVSVLDVTLQLKHDVTVAQVNTLLKQAAENELSGILAFTQEPHASVDFNHDPHSGVVDATQTRISDGSLVKLMIWFDNEWGFANRMLDTALQLSKL